MAQNVSVPYISASISGRAPRATTAPKVTTFIGPYVAADASTDTVSAELVLSIQPGQENTLFGKSSPLAVAISEFRKTNKISTIHAIGIADSELSGTPAAAKYTMTVTGTAGASGTMRMYIGAQDKYTDVSIASGDTNATIAQALEAAIDDWNTVTGTTNLVTASVATNVVTMTAKCKGAWGNDLPIQLVTTGVTGVTVELERTVDGVGAVNADVLPVSNLTTDLAGVRTDLVVGDYDDLTSYAEWMDERFNSANRILDGRVFVGSVGSASGLSGIYADYNNKSLVVFGDNPVSYVKSTGSKLASAVFALPVARASVFAAARALRFEVGASVANYLTNPSPKDSFGGPHTASLPYFNTKMTLAVVKPREGYTNSDVEMLKASGVSVMGNNNANNSLVCGEVVTTYKTNLQGNEDASFKYLEYVDTATVSREFIFNGIKANYSQVRLTYGSGVAGYGFANASTFRSAVKGFYLELGGMALLQVGDDEQSGVSIVGVFEQNLQVSVAADTGTVVISGILPLVTQVRSVIVPLTIQFNVNEI